MINRAIYKERQWNDKGFIDMQYIYFVLCIRAGLAINTRLGIFADKVLKQVQALRLWSFGKGLVWLKAEHHENNHQNGLYSQGREGYLV